ncbi:tetraacyldisaccharide 4'-kinase [Sabulilitoribacter multivorans]|uniref:Tetraacyldisaccharide 4'-kinase n=1 Tax=Flaviramulus multivorans TaxID=1304750 RepID=A0ABS9IIW0_9FLAO|nr:tetraacyldisaccharide 4'-kinase [Flaviramulus multivorans]MCF7560526.1 tetraacyldisaccharide 4'-kinase [Flaviramulus multivorans]
MKILRYILFPFVPIYYFVTWMRNKLYDWDIKKSVSYNFPVICVGNLSVGGTGKTPMIEYLVELLKNDYKVATLSRGYKRKTTGFQLANKASNADSIGDEPFQFYSKFKNDILVAVDTDRRNGIKQLSSLENSPSIILLDDAFQHRKVKAGFNILLTTYNTPYFNDIVLPTGNLREPRSGSKRADIIVVTKCPNTLTEGEKSAFLEKIKPRSNQYIFFSSIRYADKVISQNSIKNIDALQRFTLVTGLANATPLVDFLKDKGLKFEHLNFKDHHNFTQSDLEVLKSKEIIVTTEKDFMRLQHYEFLKTKLFYLPITVVINEAEKFDKLIENFVKH